MHQNDALGIFLDKTLFILGLPNFDTLKKGYVYILSNKTRTVNYTGMTSQLESRILDHKSGFGSVFTSKYKITDLMYFEEKDLITEAISREKQIKMWKKEWKWYLIKKDNPDLIDLAAHWFTKEEIENNREHHLNELRLRKLGK